MRKLRLKKSAKKQLRNILLSIICISILGGSVLAYKSLQSNKNTKKEEESTVVTKEEKKEELASKKGTIDFLAIGNSDLYSGFNPLQLYHEQGITSYSAGASMMNMSLTYYMLDEIFTYQKPKVLLLELDNYFETRGADNEIEARDTAVKNSFPLFRYTEKWEEIKNHDYTKNLGKNSRPMLRGYYYNTTVKGNYSGYRYMGKSSAKQSDVAYTKKYFPKIMQLAKDNNCQVFFACFPSKTSWTARKHNTVAEVAKQYNVPYLDFNVDDYGTGFDWETDSRDGGNHLNHSGATKMTRFIGKYLKENYHLVDHRGDANFEDWAEDYKNFIINL
ncbi:MAG: hypothetical protein RR500_04455 [Bacilli bacterium]